MTLKSLRYNDATNVVRKELPQELNVDASTAITLTINNDSGSEILAASSATLHAATTLDGDVTAGDSSFVLAAGSATLEPGDRVRLLDSDDGRPEDIVVDYYDASALTVSPIDSVLYSHASGAGVVGLFAIISIDTSNTSNFGKNSDVILMWTTAADESPSYQFDVDLYKISYIGFTSDDAIERFKTRFFSIYDTVQLRVVEIKDEAMKDLRFEMACFDMDIDRVIDQEVIMIPLVLKMGLISLGYSDTTVTERETLQADYLRNIEQLKNLPVWVDEDQDLIKEQDEVDKHLGISYGRGL